jgi:hypothetical protein
MKLLDNTTHIHGGSFGSAAGAMSLSITSMTLGAVIGGTLLDPALTYLNLQPESYAGQIKTGIANLYISYKYGHIGVETKNDIIGGIGGALIGGILGPTIFAGLSN